METCFDCGLTADVLDREMPGERMVHDADRDVWLCPHAWWCVERQEAQARR